MTSLPDDLARYHRQTLLEGIGVEGQRRLLEAHALLVGCGALGTVAAEMLGRAGVGRLTIVDRDIVELTNLQRQILFDQADVDAMLPKAEAARRKLATINPDVQVEARVEDFNHRNARALAQGVGVIVDATDNFEARFLINDLSVETGVPWVYGGAVAMSGMTMTFQPRCRVPVPWAGQETPCLRCVFEQAPPPEARLTCDTVGVLGPVASMIASIQAAEAIKLLLGRHDHINRGLLTVDLWQSDFTVLDIGGAWSEACPCCGQGDRAWLRGDAASDAVTLCGRDAVQIAPVTGGRVDLERIAADLAAHGRFTVTRFMLRGELTSEAGDSGAPTELTVFPDGRTIVRGTTQAARARSIHARYLGA